MAVNRILQNTASKPPTICFRICGGLAISTVPAGRAGDDQQLGGLQQHVQVAFFHQVAADDRAEDDQNSDNRKHGI